MNDIDKMEPGREMDALIERVIFGHDRIGYSAPKAGILKWNHIDSYLYHDQASAECAYREFHERLFGALLDDKIHPDDYRPSLCYWQHGYGPVVIPEYSAPGCIGDTWAVVEQMIADGYTPFSLYRGHNPANMFLAEFGPGAPWCSGEEGTAPLAICRAALKAKAAVAGGAK